MDKKSGCICFNQALKEHALKKKPNSLHTVICPLCHNRRGDEVICFDCSKGDP